MKFCPECGKESLRKLISPVSFRLKGTGWYETDFKTKNKTGDSSKVKPKEETNTKSDKTEKTGTKDTPGTSGPKTADNPG